MVPHEVSSSLQTQYTSNVLLANLMPNPRRLGTTRLCWHGVRILWCDGQINMLLHFSHIGLYSTLCIVLPFRFPQCHLRIDLCAWFNHRSPVSDVVKLLALGLWSAILPSSSESIKILTFVLWSVVPPSSVASKCRPFSMGNLPSSELIVTLTFVLG